MSASIDLARGVHLPARYLNRHMFVTGETGTGKTVTLLRLVDQCRELGIPVLVPDVKGDLWTLSANCGATILQPHVPLWSLGSDLLARVLELSDVQAGVLEIALVYADETGVSLSTRADLTRVLARLSVEPDLVAHLGYVTRASCGTIQRALLRMRGESTFADPATDVQQLLDSPVTLLPAATLLRETPRAYAAVLLWLLRELAKRMPEVGDAPQPRLVFIFDEAHTLFNDAPPALVRSLESTVRLIRSKGVGIVFASQAASDVPQLIAAQCATRVEHTRELGVGRARITTLTPDGRTAAPVVATVALPSFPLTAAAPVELPPPPAAAPVPRRRIDLWRVTGIAGIVGSAVGIVALVYYLPPWLVVTGIAAALALRR
jgi:DNA helicase HerA-like ATPase